jgi:hypothetical protein
MFENLKLLGGFKFLQTLNGQFPMNIDRFSINGGLRENT